MSAIGPKRTLAGALHMSADLRNVVLPLDIDLAFRASFDLIGVAKINFHVGKKRPGSLRGKFARYPSIPKDVGLVALLIENI